MIPPKKSRIDVAVFILQFPFFLHFHLSNRLSDMHPYEIGCKAVSEVAELE